jgi:hypothetical protein
MEWGDIVAEQRKRKLMVCTPFHNMTNEECKELVRRIFGDEEAKDDEVVQFYLDVNKVGMDKYAEAKAIAFEKWREKEDWVPSTVRNGKYYQPPAKEVIDYKTLDELYELFNAAP